jgi:hypothetical protein
LTINLSLHHFRRKNDMTLETVSLDTIVPSGVIEVTVQDETTRGDFFQQSLLSQGPNSNDSGYSPGINDYPFKPQHKNVPFFKSTNFFPTVDLTKVVGTSAATTDVPAPIAAPTEVIATPTEVPTTIAASTEVPAPIAASTEVPATPTDVTAAPDVITTIAASVDSGVVREAVDAMQTHFLRNVEERRSVEAIIEDLPDAFKNRSGLDAARMNQRVLFEVIKKDIKSRSGVSWDGTEEPSWNVIEGDASKVRTLKYAHESLREAYAESGDTGVITALDAGIGADLLESLGWKEIVQTSRDQIKTLSEHTDRYYAVATAAQESVLAKMNFILYHLKLARHPISTAERIPTVANVGTGPYPFTVAAGRENSFPLSLVTVPGHIEYENIQSSPHTSSFEPRLFETLAELQRPLSDRLTELQEARTSYYQENHGEIQKQADRNFDIFKYVVNQRAGHLQTKLSERLKKLWATAEEKDPDGNVPPRKIAFQTLREKISLRHDSLDKEKALRAVDILLRMDKLSKTGSDLLKSAQEEFNASNNDLYRKMQEEAGRVTKVEAKIDAILQKMLKIDMPDKIEDNLTQLTVEQKNLEAHVQCHADTAREVFREISRIMTGKAKELTIELQDDITEWFHDTEDVIAAQGSSAGAKGIVASYNVLTTLAVSLIVLLESLLVDFLWSDVINPPKNS